MSLSFCPINGLGEWGKGYGDAEGSKSWRRQEGRRQELKEEWSRMWKRMGHRGEVEEKKCIRM